MLLINLNIVLFVARWSHSEAETRVADISTDLLGVCSWRHPVVTSECILGLPGNATSSANANAVVHYHVLFKSVFHFPSKPCFWIHVTLPRRSMWPINKIKDWFQPRTSIRRWTREWNTAGIMQNVFEIRLSANFRQMYLWIHDKYSSTNFKQCCLKYNNLSKTIIQWLRSAVVKAYFHLQENRRERFWISAKFVNFLFSLVFWFFSFALFPFILTTDPLKLREDFAITYF